MRQLSDRTCARRDREQCVRTDLAAIGMMPARKGLSPDEAGVGCGKLWLKKDFYLVPIECL